MQFEVQLATPDSRAANKATRTEFEEQRLPTTPLPRREELARRQEEVWGRLEVPPGATALDGARYGVRPTSWRRTLDALVPPGTPGVVSA